MLSLVLPILALAIALTPIVVSARIAYERELAEQTYDLTSGESRVSRTVAARQSSGSVDTTI